MANGHGLDTRESRLGRRFGSADEPAHAGTQRPLRNRERSRNRTDAPVEGELADGGVLGQPLGWELPGRREHGQRDREVEPGALLPERRRREIDRDPPVERPFQGRRDDTAADAMLRLLARAIGEPDDREARNARLEVRLDLDLARLEADECVGHRACEHDDTVPGRRSRMVTVFPTRVLQVIYPT